MEEEEENWFATYVFIDRGIYKIVRHPIYLCFMLTIIALMMISQHWICFFLGLPILFYLYKIMFDEDDFNVQRFGEKYQDYMARVPRINMILGIYRMLKAKKKS